MVLESFNNGILYIDIAFVYNRCTVYKVFRIKGSDCMKIEKVNDNQIRCTLTREDLAERQIKLSELAYGTEKAKMLFRDMMQQAAYEFGFEADDIPLMIEAIPLSADTIILVITKVEYPALIDKYSRVHGKAYALPITPSTQLLFYRKDLFENTVIKRLYSEKYKAELKIPKTFEEYNKIAEFFATSDRLEEHYFSNLTLGNLGVTATEFLTDIHPLSRYNKK